MQWTTVNVGIASTLTEPFQGILTLSAQQNGLNNLIISHEFVLTPGIRLNIPMVTKFAYGAENCTVRITSEKGKTVWTRTYELWDYSKDKQVLHVLSENDLLIGLVGKREFGILRLEEESNCRYGQSVGKVFVKDKLATQLPWDWTGYCALDILVIYDEDLGQCNASQLKAIEQWVQNGGKLLLILSAHPLTENNPLSDCLPFEIKESSELNIGADTLQKIGLQPTSQHNVIAWPILTNDSMLCDFAEFEQETSIFGVGYFGFGRIGVLSFDPATLWTTQKSDTAAFWVNVLSSVIFDRVIKDELPELPSLKRASNMPFDYQQLKYQLHMVQATSVRDIIPKVEVEDESDSYYSHHYGIGLEQSGSNSVMEYLLNIPQMRPLSIWWVILLLVLLAILLGPVDYKVLKKIDRQPLTWLTCTFWIAIFTAGAYYGVQALRSGDLQYRSVSVIDSITRDPTAWSTSHAGIFAPKSDEYLLDGMEEDQWWSSIAPEQREMYYYNRQGATRNIYCRQYDGANLPYSLPINIWTMQCLLCEEPDDTFPIRAKVSIDNMDVSIEISNLSNAKIDDGYVVFSEERVFCFGSVDKLTTESFSGKLSYDQIWQNKKSSGYRETMKFQSPILRNEEAFVATGSLNRTKAFKAMAERGAAIVCVEMNSKEPVISVKDKDCEYTNRMLCRLLLFPE
jgi:hypothetical protein